MGSLWPKLPMFEIFTFGEARLLQCVAHQFFQGFVIDDSFTLPCTNILGFSNNSHLANIGSLSNNKPTKATTASPLITKVHVIATIS